MFSNLLWFATVIVVTFMSALGAASLQSQLVRSFPYKPNNDVVAEERESLVSRIRIEPLQTTALRDLALSEVGSVEMLRVSERISRRDVLTQLLLIEYATEQGDLQRAVQHYSKVLALSPNLKARVIDILAETAMNPQAYRTIYSYRDELWFPEVISRVAQRAKTGQEFYEQVASAQSPSKLLPPDQISAVIWQLILKPDPQYAFKIALLWNLKSTSIGNFGFSDLSTNPEFQPITWKLTRATRLTHADRDGDIALRISAKSNATSKIAERFTDLSEGMYRLKGNMRLEGPSNVRLIWTARCHGAHSRRVIIERVNQDTTDKHRFEYRITVPQRCNVQKWVVSVLGDDSQFDTTVDIAGVELQLLD